jgi:hypothetical protein
MRLSKDRYDFSFECGIAAIKEYYRERIAIRRSVTKDFKESLLFVGFK